jgi:F-type H+-transporting ATPase subunit delta
MELTFTMPEGDLFSSAVVDMVMVPGGDGLFGIMPDHVPTIAELKPGVVSIQETAGGPMSKYFVSGGFASMTAESKLTISALVAVPVEDLDADAVKLGLAQYQDAYAKATEDLAKCEAEIGVEVYQAMAYAINE